MISRQKSIAIAICLLLTVAVVVGSTGFGYTIYRPLRNYDIFSIAISWAGLALLLWRNRRAG